MQEAIYDTASRAERIQWLTALLAALACVFSFVAMQRAGEASEHAWSAIGAADAAGQMSASQVNDLRMDLTESGVIKP